MDEHIEDEFKRIVAESDLSDVNSVASIANMLASLKTQMENLRPLIDSAAEKKKDIEAQIKVHQSAINELKQAAATIDSETWDARKKLREIERDINSANTRLTQAIENQHLREEYQSLAEEFERLTAGAPWREFAFDHQIQGAKKLAAATHHEKNRGAILADKRGLGKSLTSMIYMDMVKAKKVLCVVPNDTVGNYMRELEHWAPHRKAVKLAGLPKTQREFLLTTLAMMDEYVVVVNYEAWRRDKGMLDLLDALQIDTLIIDESHNIKDQKTIAFKGLKQLTTSANKCSECGSGNIHVEM